MNHSEHRPQLAVVDQTGCGCGCGCATATPSDTTTSLKETVMSTSTQTFEVTGMTCGHCAQAVSSELQALDGVTDVTVDLNAGGTSRVTVTSATQLDQAQVSEALEEAGDYHLA